MTIQEKVAAGAKVLDDNYPGWDRKINLDTLNIKYCNTCILGQLFGSYGRGLDTLGECVGGDSLYHPNELAEGLGFTVLGIFKFLQNNQPLTDEWKRVIAARVEARREQAELDELCSEVGDSIRACSAAT